MNSKGDGPRCSFQVIKRTKPGLCTLWDHRVPASPGSQGNCPWLCQAGDAVEHPELNSEPREPHTTTPHHPLVNPPTQWLQQHFCDVISNLMHLRIESQQLQKTFWSSDLCFCLSFPNLAPFQLNTGDTAVALNHEHSQGLGSTTKAFVPIFTQGFFHATPTTAF